MAEQKLIVTIAGNGEVCMAFEPELVMDENPKYAELTEEEKVVQSIAASCLLPLSQHLTGEGGQNE